MDWIQSLVHTSAPHTKAAIYLLSLLSAGFAILVVYIRCHIENSRRGLTAGWLVRTASGASPIPIYCLMIIAPLDPDIIKAMMEDQVVVAIAGLYGLVETLKDIRFMGRTRRD